MSIKPKLPVDPTDIGAVLGFVGMTWLTGLALRFVLQKVHAPAALIP